MFQKIVHFYIFQSCYPKFLDTEAILFLDPEQHNFINPQPGGPII